MKKNNFKAPFRTCHRSYGYSFCNCKPGTCMTEKQIIQQERRNRITRKFWSFIDKIKKLCQI